MSTQLATLDAMPTADIFYSEYWNKKPFVVRAAIDADIFDECVDPESLAGLALDDEEFEQQIKSRIITTAEDGQSWSCEHGPFPEERFAALGQTHYSLLVQNVEQYYTDTAILLDHFNIAPRWLMDDIMVSYSTTQGSVGPHTDSYHVFLVQGMGKRSWRIGTDKIEHPELIEGIDLKVLKNPFDAHDIEVQIGDVIYIPPHFAHEGTTLENALTFSIGFLGPTLSQLLIEYAYYLEDHENHNTRYCGEDLNAACTGDNINKNAINDLRTMMSDSLHSPQFDAWLKLYFSKEPSE